VIGIDQPGAIHRDRGDRDAESREALRGFPHRVVLDRSRHHVHGAELVVEGDPLERQVVGFAPRSGEDDLLRLGADQRGHLGAGRLDRGVRALAEEVDARFVPVLGGKERLHARGDPRIEGRGRGVIEIDDALRLHMG
jgi:hypothetical protein